LIVQSGATVVAQATDTRDRIVEIAARLFHEQGYNGTGVSTILREADVNSGSLYHYFPSKEALLVAVLERYRLMLHPIVLAPVEAKTADPIERVFGLLQQYRDWLAPINFAMGCPIGNLALELSDGHEEVRKLIRDNFAGWTAGVQRWLEHAGDRVPPDVDREQLARFVLTVMEGGIMQARAEQSPRPFDASVAQLRAYFERLTRDAERQRAARQT
jgi:AcrR family transcriptional regulator